MLLELMTPLFLSYTAFYEYFISGVPPMRPLHLEFPQGNGGGGESNAKYHFMFGDTLLVKPATSEDDYNDQ
jgi:alpha-glucosidase (family GH31 glycosyl hydrolase)